MCVCRKLKSKTNLYFNRNMFLHFAACFSSVSVGVISGRQRPQKQLHVTPAVFLPYFQHLVSICVNGLAQ